MVEGRSKRKEGRHSKRRLRAYSALDRVSPMGMGYRRRRGSSLLFKTFRIGVLNGHIHQTMQKVEGNVTFHTAMSTAFPQPAPGSAPSPGPMKVPAEQLRSVLGIREVHFLGGKLPLAVVDSTLASAHAAARTAGS